MGPPSIYKHSTPSLPPVDSMPASRPKLDVPPAPVSDPRFREWADSWKSSTAKGETPALPPRATSKVLSDLEDEEAEEGIKMPDSVKALSTIHVIPVSIEIASNAPLDTLAETQALYIISKNIMANILVSSQKKGRIHPLLLGWMRQCESLLKNINGMTEGFQKEVQIKKLELARALIESNSQLGDQFKIRMIKELEIMESSKGVQIT